MLWQDTSRFSCLHRQIHVATLNTRLDGVRALIAPLRVRINPIVSNRLTKAPLEVDETSGTKCPVWRGQDVARKLNYCFRADSMALTTLGASGFTAGSKRASTLPSRPTRNLVKFHLMSPPVVGLAVLSVRN